MTKFLTLALACAIVPSALAASLWDGTWKLDRAKSHLTGDSFTLSKTANGMWHASFGDLGYDFLPDGKPYPVLDADHTITVTMNGDHALTEISAFKGKTTSTTKETLSADGTTLTDETSGTRADGTSYTSSSTSKRSGTGTGFLGKWVSTKANTSAQELFVISTAADGSVTMTYPGSKESLVTKLDGTPASPTGPQMVQGVMVTYKKTSPTRLDYTVDFKGKKIGEGYDVLSADGKTYTETFWATGKMDEKTISVYVKQ
jgi:hypothetical protein